MNNVLLLFFVAIVVVVVVVVAVTNHRSRNTSADRSNTSTLGAHRSSELKARSCDTSSCCYCYCLGDGNTMQ